MSTEQLSQCRPSHHICTLFSWMIPHRGGQLGWPRNSTKYQLAVSHRDD